MKKTPYVFLFTLLIVLVFLVGFRSGQKVEKSNKTINYLLSITPTKIPPSPTPMIYTEYKSKKWGLKFTYPNNLEIKESTTSSEISFEVK